MRVNFKKCYGASVLTKAVFLFVLSGHLMAQDCESLKVSANSQLQQIENDLVKVSTREQYEEAIQKRYDKVEDLLQTANQCLKEKNYKDWKTIKKILTSLRSNARTLLFTKFENWMQIKEQDSSLFKKPEITKPPVSDAIKNDTATLK